ncbi:MAG: phosphotransferase [Mycobacterium sp.]|nr:phosphotransferase [Mycobacterium sp.]
MGLRRGQPAPRIRQPDDPEPSRTGYRAGGCGGRRPGRRTRPARPGYRSDRRGYSSLAGGETPDARPIASLATPLARWPQLRDDLTELGLPAPDLTAEAATVTAMLADPAARTLTHTDLTPHNIVLSQDQLVLVDFEGAGYRHVGFDLPFLRFPFQNYGLLIPVPIRQAMERAYRAAFPASEAAPSEGAVALGCALLLIEVCYGIRRADDSGQSAASARRRRGRIWQLLAAALDALDRSRILPALTRWLGDLAEAVYARWPEVRVPTALFPVFR